MGSANRTLANETSKEHQKILHKKFYTVNFTQQRLATRVRRTPIDRVAYGQISLCLTTVATR